MKKNILSTLLLGLLLVGCLPSKQDLSSEAPADLPAGDVSTPESGSWSTDCISDGATDSKILLHRFENGALTSVRYIYQNTTICEPAKLNFVLMTYGPYSVTGDHSSLAGAKNFTQQVQAIYIIPQNSDAAAFLNGEIFCGHSDWVATQPKIGFGCNHSPYFDASSVSYNSDNYGVFSITSGASPSMNVGDSCNIAGYEGICPTEGDRANTLDPQVLYKR